MKIRRAIAIGALAVLGISACTANTSEDDPPEPTTDQTADNGHQNAEGNDDESNQGADEQTDVGQEGEPGETDAENDETADRDEETVNPSDFTSSTQESANYGEGDRGEVPSYPIEVRFGQHDGFDRLTFEHVGDADLGYFAQYEDSIRLENGDELDLAGETVLHVRVTGVALEEDVGEDALTDREAFSTDSLSTISEVKTFGPWEGTYHYYVGLDAERPFNITLEESPLRLVIDIADG